jgi:hypothetical protein
MGVPGWNLCWPIKSDLPKSDLARSPGLRYDETERFAAVSELLAKPGNRHRKAVTASNAALNLI